MRSALTGPEATAANVPPLPIVERLEATLALDHVPQHYAQWGRGLLHRLRKPVQLVVVGLPSSGKSAVIDMLLGRTVIGSSPAAGLTEVCFGPVERAELHLADSNQHRTLSHDGVLAQIAAQTATDTAHAAPLRQRQELPDTRLRGLNIAEITLSGSTKEQADILDQAVRYGDILLWCSRAFEPEEQTLWAAVPDSAKDHAFLVLSMADQLIMRGTLPSLMEALSPLAAEEFLGLYPLAAIQGLNAQQTRSGEGSGLDRELWHKSGGKRLYDDLMQHVDRGRTADLDLAEALVLQFGDPNSVSAPAPSVPAQPQPSPAETAPSQEDLLAATARKIKERAATLLPTGDPSEGDVEQVLQGALECVRQLGQDLSGLDDRHPKVRAAQEAAQDGEEVLMLCQIEQDVEAATDAITLLLQLKRELSPA